MLINIIDIFLDKKKHLYYHELLLQQEPNVIIDCIVKTRNLY